MNSYEFANATEIGRAADIIQGLKVWTLFVIDSEGYIHYMENWIFNDLDESDD